MVRLLTFFLIFVDLADASIERMEVIQATVGLQ